MTKTKRLLTGICTGICATGLILFLTYKYWSKTITASEKHERTISLPDIR